MLSEELTEVSAYSCTGNWTQEEETFTVSRAEAAGDYVLTNAFPQLEYMYGCVATSMGMLLAYYDLYGYTVNGQTYKFNNLIEGTVSVNSRGSDGGSIYDMKDPSLLATFTASSGYVSRFYRTDPDDELEYTFIDGDPSKGLNVSAWDCLADYLGTGQYWRGNDDLSTKNYITSLQSVSNSTQTEKIGNITIPIKYGDSRYGLSLYVESQGYSLDPEATSSFSISNFSFEKFKQEIDAGRPVLLSMQSGGSGHMVIAYGYNADTQEVIFDDTYRTNCRMKWDGTYEYSNDTYRLNGVTTVVLDTSTADSGSGGGGKEDPPEEKNLWYDDLDEALAAARELGVPILVYYGNRNTCHYCKLLEDNVFASDEFLAYAESSSVILLDNVKVPGLSYSGTPACFLIDADQKVISKYIGYGNGWMNWFTQYVDLVEPEEDSIDLTAKDIQLTDSSNAVISLEDLPADKPLYLSFDVVNEGKLATGSSFTVTVKLDDKVVSEKVITSLKGEGTSSVSGLSLGSVSSGKHTLSIVVDSKNAIKESDEDNNIITKAFTAEEKEDIDDDATVDSTLYVEGVVSSGLRVIDGGKLYVRNGGTVKNTVAEGGEIVVSRRGFADSVTLTDSGILTVSNGGSAARVTVVSGGSVSVSSGATVSGLTVSNGGNVTLHSGSIAGGTIQIDGSGNISAEDGAVIRFDISNRNSSQVFINDLSRITGNAGYSVTVSEKQSEGKYLLAANATNFNSTISVCSTSGICYGSISVGSSVCSDYRCYTVSLNDGVLALEVKSSTSGGIVSSGGSSGGIVSSGGSSGGIVSSGGYITVCSGGVCTSAKEFTDQNISSGMTVNVYQGGIMSNTGIMRYGNANIYNGGQARTTVISAGGNMILSSGAAADTTVINAQGGLHVYSGATANSTTVKQSGFLGVGLGATANNTTIDYAGELTVWGGGRVNDNTINQWGAIILSSGAVADTTVINSQGGLHVYSGATANNTTVKQSGFLGVGLGATANNTTIDYAGELTVWGGGKVNDNTIDQWGAIILSSGAVADTTVINAQGGLHVYSGATANNTTVKQSGFFGVGLGATANNTTIDYAGALTVWGGGVVNDNTINQWGAIILSSGAAANGTVINPDGGLHIYNGAAAYNTQITSGANLGIGYGGLLYSAELENTGTMTFYEGAKLGGWNDLAGTVITSGSVNAAGSYINFELSDRTTDQDVILDDMENLVSVGRYSIEIDPMQESGTYYLASNAWDFDSRVSLYIGDGVDCGSIGVGETLEYEGKSYTLRNTRGTLTFRIS